MVKLWFLQWCSRCSWITVLSIHCHWSCWLGLLQVVYTATSGRWWAESPRFCIVKMIILLGWKWYVLIWKWKQHYFNLVLKKNKKYWYPYSERWTDLCLHLCTMLWFWMEAATNCCNMECFYSQISIPFLLFSLVSCRWLLSLFRLNVWLFGSSPACSLFSSMITYFINSCFTDV